MAVKRNRNSRVIGVAGLAVLLLFLISVKKELGRAESSLGDIMQQETARAFSNALYHSFVPSFSFVREKRRENGWLLEQQVTGIIPLYGYTREQYEEETWGNDVVVLDDILLAEAMEESFDGEEAYESERIGADTRNMTLEELLQAENEKGLQVDQEMAIQVEGEAALEAALQAEREAALQAENEAALQVENEAAREALQNKQIFIPHTLCQQIDMTRLESYETLVQDFYTIDKNTMAGSDQLNVGKLLEQDLRISKESDGPQILIYHTHSQEGFADSVPGDTGTTIMGVGDRLADILQDTYGYQVLHHTGQYDVDSRDDAYSKALPAIEQVLKENPSIEVIIDLHRDEMAEETKLVMDLDGRPTARFMFFNGLSRTRKTGNISYLYNENQAGNLAFSFQMQLKATEYYPGLTRKIYLKGYRYNMHLRPRTLLVELGAQNNTVEEAMNACDPLAHILDMVLSGQ